MEDHRNSRFKKGSFDASFYNQNTSSDLSKKGSFDASFYNQNISSHLINDVDVEVRKDSAAVIACSSITYGSVAEKHSYKVKNIDNVEKVPKKHSRAHEIQLYRKRFLILLLFAMCSMMNGFTSFQYTVVADIVSCYYGVSLSSVNWTCDIHMLVFLVLVFPVMYFMDKKGIRITLIIGAVLNFLGSFVQCFTFAPDRFPVIMTCQFLYALGQVFIVSLPPFIAAVWFGAGEVGLACALGVFGNQLGVALGFIIPSRAITNNCTAQVDISWEFRKIAFPMTIINGIILVVIYFGFVTGTYIGISTLINEKVLIHFPGEEVVAGMMGAVLVFAGMFGSLLIGFLLDKTHKYKQISIFAFAVSFLLLLSYTFLIKLEKIWIQMVMFILLGFIMTGYLPAGFDFAAEITYPEPEAMSASLLNASTQIFSMIITNIASPLLEIYGDFSSNIFFCACVLFGTIIMAFIKCELKREKADQEVDDAEPQIIQHSIS